MKLAIMQPYFFPYLGYFQLINSVDKFILYENLSFRKESWMTRNRILAVKANPLFIHVPIKSKSSYKKISEIKIVDDKKWKETLKKNIYFNYKNSKYYNGIFPSLEKIIDTKTDSLHTFNSTAICNLAKLLGIDTKIDFVNSQYLKLENDLKLKFEINDLDNPFQTLKRKTERIILITKQENANVFINPIGGTTLYSKTEFAQCSIDLFFLQTKDYFYRQSSRVFFRDLSIIDVLLNCGIDNTKDLLNQFDLI